MHNAELTSILGETDNDQEEHDNQTQSNLDELLSKKSQAISIEEVDDDSEDSCTGWTKWPQFWTFRPEFLEFFSLQNPTPLRGFGEKSDPFRLILSHNICLPILKLAHNLKNVYQTCEYIQNVSNRWHEKNLRSKKLRFESLCVVSALLWPTWFEWDDTAWLACCCCCMENCWWLFKLLLVLFLLCIFCTWYVRPGLVLYLTPHLSHTNGFSSLVISERFLKTLDYKHRNRRTQVDLTNLAFFTLSRYFILMTSNNFRRECQEKFQDYWQLLQQVSKVYAILSVVSFLFRTSIGQVEREQHWATRLNSELENEHR